MVASIFATAEREVESLRHKARQWSTEAKEAREQASRSIYASGASHNTPFDAAAVNYDEAERARRQYEAFRDTAYTAIRPIMNTGAEQPIRCGLASQRAQIVKGTDPLDRLYQKWLSPIELDETRAIVAPSVFQKDIGKNITPLDDHPFLKLLATPNELMTGYALKQVSFASMALTGRFVWWFDASGDPRQDVPELGSLRLWYIPRSWLRRSESTNFNKWKIQAPGMAGGTEVSAGDLFISTMHDPGNPLLALSPLQSQAKSVDTDDKILRAQSIAMDNSMRPNLLVIAGRLPGMGTGQGRLGPRPILTGDQRGQIIDAIKLHLQGVSKWGEPLILDGLIEDAKPFMPGPAELDLVNSSQVIKERVMQGLGVSPVVAGYTENANRAGSVIAKEIFYDLCLNPMISMVSQDMDSVLGPRFSLGGRRLRIWMETAQSSDPEAMLARVTLGKEFMLVEELRDYMMTGKLTLGKLPPELKGKLVAEALRAMAPVVPPQAAMPAGSRSAMTTSV